MLKFTAEQIQNRFEQLPKEIQDAVTSADVHDSIVSIAKKYNLHIDQEGELVDQVGLAMLGLSPSKDFTTNFSNSSGVDMATARSISEDINNQIFAKIRNSMRQLQEKQETSGIPDESVVNRPISDVERLGDFTIEPQQGKDDRGIGHIESKARLINDIENPAPVEIDGFPDNKTSTSNTEPLVDHLLSGPIVSTEKKTTVEAPKFTPKPSPKPSTADLYREPIE